ncbi:MAG: PEP-CTERM sorting domain-containing protein [Verrucomicrobiota bacterium]
MNHLKLIFVVIISMALVSTELKSATIHEETIDGDLAGTPGSPTGFTVIAGLGTIVGSVGANGNTGATNGSDADYFSFNVPLSGVEITSLTLDSYTTFPNSSGFGSFLAYRFDSTSPGFPGQGFGDIDRSTIFNASTTDLLGALGLTSLQSGFHSFWIQETAPTTVNYSITYEAVPEPSTYALLILATSSGLLWRRRSRKWVVAH